MTTALYLLRCFQIGLHVADLEQLSYGMVQDIITENYNDRFDYKKVASQSDFDRF